MSNQLLHSIETFYDCVGTKYDYQRALEAFSAGADDTGMMLGEVYPLRGRITGLADCNIPKEAVEAMLSGNYNAESHTLMKHFALIPERVPVLRRSFVSDEEHYESRMYKETSEPWGLHSEGTTILKKSLLSGLACGFVRNPDQSEIDHEILSKMALMNVHLWRSISLRKRLDKLEEALIQSSNVLDLVEFGLILYDGTSMTPVFVNKSAHDLLHAEDGLSLTPSGLVIHDQQAHRQFHNLLETLNRRETPVGARAGGIVRAKRPSRRKPYSLMAVPMNWQSQNLIDSVTTAILLFDPAKKRTTTLRLFTTSYGLTRSEALLAQALAEGSSLDEYAQERGVSINTAKSQLRSIFAKTETSRQPELISLLLRSAAGMNLK